MEEKSILSQYVDVEILMKSDNAEKFDRLFETILFLLRLKYNLKSEIVSHTDGNITLYSRNKSGYSDFCMRFDNESFFSNIYVNIYSLLDVGSISKISFNPNLGVYEYNSLCSEEEVLELMNDLLKNI